MSRARIIHSLQGDTADAIAWRYYGDTPGALEAILEANRHLASQGTLLPIGLTIRLPEIEAPEVPLRELWPEPSR